MTEMKYIMVYKDNLPTLQEMEFDEVGRLVVALLQYATTGNTNVQLQGEKYVYLMMRAQIDRDSENYKANSDRNRANGSKGGRPRKTPADSENPVVFSKTQNNPENPVVFSETQNNPLKPTKSLEREREIEIHIPPESPKGESVDTLFSDFWKAYPRKVAKANALKAWTKLAPDEALTRQIIAAVEAFRLSPDWLKDNGAFIPHPATFLNGRRWEDELSPSPPAQPRRIDRDVADLNDLYP